MRILIRYGAWVILILFLVLLSYIGFRAFHFNHPYIFIITTVISSAVIILLFLILKNIEKHIEIKRAKGQGEP